MDELQQIFCEDASELIKNLEEVTLKLENNKTDKDFIAQVFRAMHSLKGAAGMFGFNIIGEFTHDLEDIYDNVRNGKIKVDTELMDITLSSVDHLKKLLADPNLNDKQLRISHKNLLKRIKSFHKNINSNKSIAETEITKAIMYHITIRIIGNIQNLLVNPQYLISEIQALGKTKFLKNTNNLKNDNGVIISWNLLLLTDKEKDEIKSIFIFVEDEIEYTIKQVSDELILNDANFLNSFTNKIEHNLSQQNTPTQTAEVNPVHEKKVGSINKIRDSHKAVIKVSSDKIDELMNLVSELVTTQAELGVIASLNSISRLTSVAENIEKISRRLRDNALNICLIPLEEILINFQRLVRDLSKELKKDVIFITEGTETELDKRIIENLKDPFMHILRNAMDHGIGTAEERLAEGKPAKGTIRLKAFYSGAEVHIQVIDDGRGIDSEKIRLKAIEKGIITQVDTLTQKELFDLVFLPGFSTAAKVTDVSGRGVGMDVVKKKINEINGVVEIDSVLGKGTTVTIKLPLSLSIVDALLVKIDKTHFLIPLSYVVMCDEASHKEIISAVNNRIKIDDELIPFLYLREEFDINDNLPVYERLIVIKYEGLMVALVVDSIVGEHQAVLKPLGDVKCNEDIISGASILGDGSVALVIDTNKLVKYFRYKKAESVTKYMDSIYVVKN